MQNDWYFWKIKNTSTNKIATIENGYSYILKTTITYVHVTIKTMNGNFTNIIHVVIKIAESIFSDVLTDFIQYVQKIWKYGINKLFPILW